MISFIIINWNTRELTAKCIDSVIRIAGASDHEIILVDNASSDDSMSFLKKHYSQVHFIENTENLGYARANNQAMKIARGDIFILLNSDVELKDDHTLQRLAGVFANHAEIGVLGTHLILPSGKTQALGREFITLQTVIKRQLLFASAFQVKAKSGDLILTDYVDGAFLAVRRTTVDQAGMFREDFFMYGEDMEWCKRIQSYGWKVAVLPDIDVLHHHGASSKKDFARMLVASTQNSCRFIASHQSVCAARTAFIVYCLGMFLRIPLSLLRNNGLAADYWRGLIFNLKHMHTLFRELKWQKSA